MNTDFEDAIDAILAKDSRYGRDAYLFLRETLEHLRAETLRKGGTPRHLNGRELLEGLRELALTQFGPMAWTVLDDWGIHACSDWGEVVFNLIDQQVLTKTPTDSREDFREVYDFDEAFRRPFQPARGAAAP